MAVSFLSFIMEYALPAEKEFEPMSSFFQDVIRRPVPIGLNPVNKCKQIE
jgi:hypothetical protein